MHETQTAFFLLLPLMKLGAVDLTQQLTSSSPCSPSTSPASEPFEVSSIHEESESQGSRALSDEGSFDFGGDLEAGYSGSDILLDTSPAALTDLARTSESLGQIWSKNYSVCGVFDEDAEGEANDVVNAAGRHKRFVHHGERWETTSLTWALRTMSSNPRVTEDMVIQAMTRATKIWSDNSGLSFTRVSPTHPRVDIIVDFYQGSHGDPWPFHQGQGVLAHAFYPPHGNIHFNDYQNFASDSAPESISLLYVAAHELGHSLGLRHSGQPGALMAPRYTDMPPGFQLPDDDKYGIQALYGPPARPVVPEPTRPTQRTPRPTQEPRYSSTAPSDQGPRPEEDPCHRKVSLEESEPDYCPGELDAAAAIRREIFLFKGKYLWRLNEMSGYKHQPGYPAKIQQVFGILPMNLDHVDAVFESLGGSDLVFFSGNHYHWLRGERLEYHDEGTLQDLGMGADVLKIDAAFTWGHNGRTYFLSGDQYWRFDPDRRMIDSDYPRHFAVWQGLPPNVSAAFTFQGRTYFFAGNVFWLFDNARMAVMNPAALTRSYWFDCPNERFKCSP